MIGSRATAAGLALATAIGTAGVLGGGSPRPEVDIGARAAVADAAADTLTAIDALRERLAPAVEAARGGAARVVAGTDAPDGPLREAGERLREAVSWADAVGEARVALDRSRRSLVPRASALPEAPSGDELASIALQLDASADAAVAFVEMRLRAERLTGLLAGALTDAESGDLAAAETAVASARADADMLEAWEIGSDSLPVWLDTVDAMIGAMERMLDALQRADTAAAESAAAAFLAVAEEAPSADRALRIGLGEAGAAVTSAPLERLASALDMLDVLALAASAAREAAAG